MEPQVAPTPSPSQNIKSITFHFSSGEILTVEVGKYVVVMDIAGLFIKERLENVTGVALLHDEMRTKKFIQMGNVNYLDFEYNEEPNVLHMGT